MLTTAQIAALLKPGLKEVMGKYEAVEKTYPKIFKTAKSEKASEQSVQMRMLGLPQLKAEGAATYMDNNSGQRFIYNATSFAVGMGYAITKEAQEDNLYTEAFNGANLSMVNSFNQFKERRASIS